MAAPCRVLQALVMTDQPSLATGTAVPELHYLGLTREEFDALDAELEELRTRHRHALARRLREARESGSPGDGDEVLAVLQEVSTEETRIADLEALLRAAPIVDVARDGIAAVGCTVRVLDGEDREAEYRLVGRRSEQAARDEVTPGSPVGRALLGAQAGDVVRVTLPDGRLRELRVLDVAHSSVRDVARAA